MCELFRFKIHQYNKRYIKTLLQILNFFIRHRLQKLLINRTSKSKLGLPKPDDRF